MGAPQPARHWFALHVRMRERNVEMALQHKGFEIFSPYYVRHTIGARGRRLEARLPLFPGYLFCSLDPHERLSVLTVPGVKAILGLGTTVTPIPPEEINAIRTAVSSGLPFEPCQLLEPGETVVVQGGPLAGITGSVFRYKGKHRLVITIAALNNRAVSVEVEHYMVARKVSEIDSVIPGLLEQVRPVQLFDVPMAAH